MSIRLSLTFAALSAAAFSVASQDTGKSRAVQEDPILTTVQQPHDRQEDDALALPSDPENSDNNKVQQDQLLRSESTAADADEPKTVVEPASPAPARKNAPEPQAKVQEDPILQPPPVSPQKPKKRENDAAGTPKPPAERESDLERQLVPKPKDKAVQEDPLLRMGTPF